MLLITCPWCGERAQVEFSYGGDATVERPDNPAAIELSTWLDHIYLRDNPRGLHLEWWHHSAGCRQWFKVHRDTHTHKIHSSSPASPNPSGDDG